MSKSKYLAKSMLSQFETHFVSVLSFHVAKLCIGMPSCFFLSFIFYLLICVCEYVWTHAYPGTHVKVSGPLDIVGSLLFYSEGSGGWTQVIQTIGKHFHLLSQFAASFLFLKNRFPNWSVVFWILDNDCMFWGWTIRGVCWVCSRFSLSAWMNTSTWATKHVRCAHSCQSLLVSMQTSSDVSAQFCLPSHIPRELYCYIHSVWHT